LSLLFRDLWFSLYRSFASFIKFIPRYFNIFDAIANGIVFLISFSDSSLLLLYLDQSVPLCSEVGGCWCFVLMNLQLFYLLVGLFPF
jgi:hypothetical protein